MIFMIHLINHSSLFEAEKWRIFLSFLYFNNNEKTNQTLGLMPNTVKVVYILQFLINLWQTQHSLHGQLHLHTAA